MFMKRILMFSNKEYEINTIENLAGSESFIQIHPLPSTWKKLAAVGRYKTINEQILKTQITVV